MPAHPAAARSWRHWLAAQWQTTSAITLLLAPLSLLYWVVVSLRRLAYRVHGMRSERVPAVVCVVGNLIAGGAGKTPTVIAIVQHLQQRGIRTGVVSRGYGREARELHDVTPSSDAHSAGDEPILIHQRTGAPLMVGASRVDAARALLAKAPEIQVIVCDDGLQHYAIYRDVEICVVDDRGTGNGWMLPAGPLREPVNASPIAAAGQRTDRRLTLATASIAGFQGHVAKRKLATHARGRDGSLIELQPGSQPWSNGCAAVAGIARPERFFQMLEDCGIHLQHTVALADHDNFSAPLPAWAEQMQILCTEKDATKLWERYPNALAVPLEQEMDADFWQAFDTLLQDALDAQLSSVDGHTTA